MKTLSPQEKAAINEYKMATSEQKQLLIKIFGADIFKETHDYTNINTWNKVLEACGQTQEDFDKRTQYLEADEKGYIMWKLVCRAINGNWVANFSDTKQPKCIALVDYNESLGRFVFDTSDYYCTGTYAGCGPRLCFENEEKLTFAFKTFGDILNQFMSHEQ